MPLANEKANEKSHIHTDYLDPVINVERFERLMNQAVLKLRAVERKGVKFDAIAVRGNSGTLFGGALCLRLNKKLFLVRKRSEDAHSGLHVEGDDRAQSYIFVDDFVSSGDTLKTVVREMNDHFPSVKYVGRYGYKHGTFELPITDLYLPIELFPRPRD